MYDMYTLTRAVVYLVHQQNLSLSNSHIEFILAVIKLRIPIAGA